LAFLCLAGERSEQRDQTELAILTPNNTTRRAQASRSYHRLRRGEKDFSSDEVGMTTSLALNFVVGMCWFGCVKSDVSFKFIS
jgi:hypothetical protein